MTSIQVNWQPTSEERYWEMLEVLPPAFMTGGGFLVGEPFDHGLCAITRSMRPRYEAFIQDGGKFYVSDRALTIPEFKHANRP